MAKNTYAYQATKIMNKYKKRLGDNFTKRDTLAEKGLELEMNRLKDQQEAVKESMAFDDEFNQIEQLTYGGSIKIKKSNVGKFTAAAKKRGMGVQEFADKVISNKDKYSPSMVKKAVFASNAAKWKKKYGGSLLPKKQEGDYLTPITPRISTNLNYNLRGIDEEELIAQEEAARAQANLEFAQNSDNFYIDPFSSEYQNYGLGTDKYSTEQNMNGEMKYYNPTLGGTSIIPLATSVAGNLLMYNRAKPTTVKYDRVRPETISLASERDQARRDAELARNINLRNARNLGLSAGASATMGIGAISDINRVSGERIGKSYLQEQLANKQSREAANRINTEIGMRETDANLREKDVTQSIKDQAIQNIIQSTGQYFSDVQKAKDSNQWKNIYSPTYKLYEDPNQSWIDRLLFGQSPIGKQDTSQYTSK